MWGILHVVRRVGWRNANEEWLRNAEWVSKPKTKRWTWQYERSHERDSTFSQHRTKKDNEQEQKAWDNQERKKYMRLYIYIYIRHAIPCALAVLLQIPSLTFVTKTPSEPRRLPWRATQLRTVLNVPWRETPLARTAVWWVGKLDHSLGNLRHRTSPTAGSSWSFRKLCGSVEGSSRSRPRNFSTKLSHLRRTGTFKKVASFQHGIK